MGDIIHSDLDNQLTDPLHYAIEALNEYVHSVGLTVRNLDDFILQINEFYNNQLEELDDWYDARQGQLIYLAQQGVIEESTAELCHEETLNDVRYWKNVIDNNRRNTLFDINNK